MAGKNVIELTDANFEADLRRIRVELDNPADWPSGLTSWVRFTAPEGEWATRIAPEKKPPSPVAVGADR